MRADTYFACKYFQAFLQRPNDFTSASREVASRSLIARRMSPAHNELCECPQTRIHHMSVNVHKHSGVACPGQHSIHKHTQHKHTSAATPLGSIASNLIMRSFLPFVVTISVVRRTPTPTLVAISPQCCRRSPTLSVLRKKRNFETRSNTICVLL